MSVFCMGLGVWSIWAWKLGHCTLLGGTKMYKRHSTHDFDSVIDSCEVPRNVTVFEEIATVLSVI